MMYEKSYKIFIISGNFKKYIIHLRRFLEFNCSSSFNVRSKDIYSEIIMGFSSFDTVPSKAVNLGWILHFEISRFIGSKRLKFITI